MQKNFLSPIRVYAMVQWQGFQTETTNLELIGFQKLLLIFTSVTYRSQDLFVKEAILFCMEIHFMKLLLLMNQDNFSDK